MKAKDRKLAAVKYGVSAAAAIGLFWTVWHFAVGEVPVVTSIKMTNVWVWDPPFAISRWWDVFFGPAWIGLVVFTLTNTRSSRETARRSAAFIAGLATGTGLFLLTLMDGVYISLMLLVLLAVFTTLIIALVGGTNESDSEAIACSSLLGFCAGVFIISYPLALSFAACLIAGVIAVSVIRTMKFAARDIEKHQGRGE